MKTSLLDNAWTTLLLVQLAVEMMRMSSINETHNSDAHPLPVLVLPRFIYHLRKHFTNIILIWSPSCSAHDNHLVNFKRENRTNLTSFSPDHHHVLLITIIWQSWMRKSDLSLSRAKTWRWFVKLCVPKSAFDPDHWHWHLNQPIIILTCMLLRTVTMHDILRQKEIWGHRMN